MNDDKKIEFAEECASARQVREKVDPRKEVRRLLGSGPAELKKAKDLLAEDLKRVFNHPLNPFAGSSASRDRYRQLGHHSEALVTALFGNHEEFQRFAGLRDQRNTTRSRNKGARLHTEAMIAEFAQRQLSGLAGRFDYAKRLDGWLSGVTVSDIHSHYCDPFAERVFFDCLRITQPDVVVVNGDLVDFPEISTHPHFPGHFGMSLEGEVVWAKRFLSRIRLLLPGATIYFVIGNHEYRIIRYIADTARALHSLDPFDFDKHFGLTESEISLVCRSNFLAPTRKRKASDVQENWMCLRDVYYVTHGIRCGPGAATKEMQRYGASGTSGHTHTPAMVFGHTAKGWTSWMTTPALANVAAVGRDYQHGPHNWTMGFGTFGISPRGHVDQSLVIVGESDATFAGRTWKIEPKEKRARTKLVSV